MLSEFLKNSFTLITGIAAPKPLTDFLKNQGAEFEHLHYPDHHSFTSSDLKSFERLDLILTTQKDYMRLKDHELLQNKLFYLPISIEFLADENQFQKRVLSNLS